MVVTTAHKQWKLRSWTWELLTGHTNFLEHFGLPATETELASNKILIRRVANGNSLGVHWLGVLSFSAEGLGLTPVQGTKIPQVMQLGQGEKKTNNNNKKKKQMFAVSSFSHVEMNADNRDVGHKQHQKQGPNQR